MSIGSGHRCLSRFCSHAYRNGRSFQNSCRTQLSDANDRNTGAVSHGSDNSLNKQSSPKTNHMRLKASQKDLMIDVLGASTTKREAKYYLTRLQSENRRLEFSQQRHPTSSNNKVNLGSLYESEYVRNESDGHGAERMVNTEPRHVAIVLLRAPDRLSDEILSGVTKTIAQLSQLGMHCIIMPDLRDYLTIAERRFNRDETRESQEAQRRQKLISQADRIVDALESHLDQRARRMEYLFKVDQHSMDLKHLDRGRIVPAIENMNLLMQCLDSGTIPVVLPIVRTKNLHHRSIHTKQALISLSRALAGTANLIFSQETIEEKISRTRSASPSCSVDRIIVLDSVGGIPAGPTFQKPHVFINLEQEYDTVKQELDELYNIDSYDARRDTYLIQETAGEHLKNLSLVRRALKFLPPSSSALITSPEAVVRYEHNLVPSATPDVGTRSQRNILIHNILTDKPIRSSSLPQSRVSKSTENASLSRTELTATFLKHGMPLTIVPDPKTQPWTAPRTDVQILSLSDPRLDIGRLVHLIEDSFGRPLDQKHYFDRIAPSLAGIIIAGAYEGGAILTWERPSSAYVDDTSRLVPYLDKFAVLKRSQGSGGVADIVFSAMVRDCFPQGVCWRSRSNNPVNKWYFERALGTARLLPRDNQDQAAQSWTMFWTTEGVQGQRYQDYEEVCRSIPSSWADGKQRLD